ncbi:MAG: glutathione S-transferase family protein [Sandaracinaceae bacterium]
MADLLVHHLERSRSQRVLFLLEELGLDYEIVRYERGANDRAPKALRDVHPLGKSPVLQHGDTVVAESGAIVEYVIDELADGRMRPPPGTEAARRYRFFLHFAEGSMMAPLLVKLICSKVRAAIPLVGPMIAGRVDKSFTDAEIRAHLTFVDRELEGREWLASGEPTGADVMMSYPLMAAMSRGGLAGGFPNVRAYLDRIGARPAYRRAIEKGGPVELDA